MTALVQQSKTWVLRTPKKIDDGEINMVRGIGVFCNVTHGDTLGGMSKLRILELLGILEGKDISIGYILDVSGNTS